MPADSLLIRAIGEAMYACSSRLFDCFMINVGNHSCGSALLGFADGNDFFGGVEEPFLILLLKKEGQIDQVSNNAEELDFMSSIASLTAILIVC